MTADISRHSLRPAQNFTGVVRQQGRLPIDADETESDDLANLLLRQVVAETICTRGSPDDGFRIGGVTLANGLLDFEIAAGSFFLGGTRLASAGHDWSSQPDWLTMVNADRAFALPAAGQERTDLIWLLGWEQTVTATEDAELLEPALGGPDTTARRRAMWRVNLLTDVPDTCPEAFADLVARVAVGGTLNADESEIVSNARLTVGFTQLEPLEDLCRPQAQAGFLGARNEAFRILVTEPGRFVWGRDNAAPLYRVQVTADANGDLRKIRFLTLPRDEFGWPLTGMTVELLRWGSLLANQEKAAEPLGYFASVTGGFDPGDDNSILIATTDDGALNAFLATPVPANAGQPLDDADVRDFIFLRVWTGGGTAGEADNPMPIAAAGDLGETGLTLHFANDGMAGDYWVVAARPNTPTRVLPWALLDNAPPAGPRRLIAPLALLPSDNSGIGDVIDCRHRFRPLCEVGACCRVTVGDGRTSFGDVLSIQEAIDRLPAEGGEVCIHPGEYREHVTITGRRNVLITGCGRTSVWMADEETIAPLLTLEGCTSVVVRRVAMVNLMAECVLADVPDGQGIDASDAVGVEDVMMVAADRPAVHIRDGRDHVVRRCRVVLEDLSVPLSDDPDIGRGAAIFLQGRDLLVEHSIIGPLRGKGTGPTMPAGGIHIGGGSRAVLIRYNEIAGGNGHGITLGSVQFIPDNPDEPIILSANSYYTDFIRKNSYYAAGYGNGAIGSHGLGFAVTDQDCITSDGTPPDPGDGDIDVTPESGGVVQDVRIYHNDITAMGYSGISAHVFSGLGEEGAGDLIAVERVDIRGNRIGGCMQNETGDISPLLRLFTGWGGIALSFAKDLTVRDNHIERNGTRRGEAICGIFTAIAEDVRIEGNRIHDNGTNERDVELVPGPRGGIFIGLAMGGTASANTDAFKKDATESDLPALIVANNTVAAPNARALRAVLLGPGIIHGNRLTGANRSALFTNPLAALVGAWIGLTLSGEDISDPRESLDLVDYISLWAITDLLGGDAVMVMNLAVAEEMGIFLKGGASTRLAGGETMINDNQIILRAHSGTAPGTVSALLAASMDDVSVCDNQIEIENDTGFFITNGLVFGATVRAQANRWQEKLLGGFLSLVSYGFLNNTSLNQSTHCILATGLPAGLVTNGNRSFFDLFPQGQEFCGRFEEMGKGLGDKIGTRGGFGQMAGDPA